MSNPISFSFQIVGEHSAYPPVVDYRWCSDQTGKCCAHDHILNCGWIDVYVVMDQIASGVREIILPDWTLPSGIVHAVFRSRRGLSPAIRSFIDFLALEFRA
jgi:hypothetical protein